MNSALLNLLTPELIDSLTQKRGDVDDRIAVSFR